ncbi:hypothetical protein [Endomicrobium proavitum]|uniref:hypothetical protein n=1 Tax=Endomicrobium proavitum TaxID=1408281 RepID=UPI000695A54A|nr:hypothetical protein [Endomicrobium proavitum]
MSISGVFKVISKVAKVAGPQITKLIDYKRALSDLKAENEILAAEIIKLRKLQIISTIVIAALFTVSVIFIVLYFSK